MIIEDITKRVDRLMVISNLQKKEIIKKVEKPINPYSTYSTSFHNNRLKSCFKRPLSNYTPKTIRRPLQNPQLTSTAYTNLQTKKRVFLSQKSETSSISGTKKSRNPRLYIRPFTAKMHIRDCANKLT